MRDATTQTDPQASAVAASTGEISVLASAAADPMSVAKGELALAESQEERDASAPQVLPVDWGKVCPLKLAHALRRRIEWKRFRTEEILELYRDDH